MTHSNAWYGIIKKSEIGNFSNFNSKTRIMLRKILSIIIFSMCLNAKAQEPTDTTIQDHEAVLEQQLSERDAKLAALDAKLTNIENKERLKSIWGPGRFTKISYNFASTGDDVNPVDKSELSVSLAKGTSYMFPGKPIAGMLKFGIDVTWFDLTYTKYKKHDSTSSGGWLGSDTNGGFGYDEDYWKEYSNGGRMSLNLGLFGLGARASVAPFSTFNNELRFLRASMYFHVQPTISAYIVNDDGEAEGSYAYMGMFRFGGCIHYRRVAFGVEGYWGKSKFDVIDFDSYFDEDSDSNRKVNRKFASTRLYIQFAF